MNLQLTDSTGVLLLAAASLIGLLLIPFGLPGLWVILLGIIGYGWITEGGIHGRCMRIEQRSGGGPLRIRGGCPSAAHAADGIVRGHPVTPD